MEVGTFDKRWEAWLYEHIGLPLARRLAASGLGAHPRVWQAIARVWPPMAAATALFAASESTRTIYWVWTDDEDDEDVGVEDVLADVDALINRAPTPLGEDDYAIFVDRLGPLPGEENGVRVPFPAFERTLGQRKVVARWTLTGHRWRDWKRGDGKERLRQVLAQAQPTREAPVTLITPVVEGAVMAEIFLK